MRAPPGVYVQEPPGGAMPIPGVATANTAFIGVLGRGPVAVPTRITSWAEFERIFGGLHADCETSYALRNFYMNGGRIALVLRVASGALAARATLPPDTGGLTLVASSPGAWGNNLRVAITRASSTEATSFDLLIHEYRGNDVIRDESFLSLSITADDPRHVARVLTAESQLVTVIASGEGDAPAPDDIDKPEPLPPPDPGASMALSGGTDGTLPADSDDFAALTATAHIAGIDALDVTLPDAVNLMCLPDLAVLGHARRAAAAMVYQAANACCERNLAFLIIDSLTGTTRANIDEWTALLGDRVGRNAALYYPHLSGPDPLHPAQKRDFAASGAVAGIYARTDAARGVWKAPAGIEAGVRGGLQPIEMLTDVQQAPLNAQGVNIIRTFPVYNVVVWGARTLDGADALASEWKYIPVRRLALYIEASLSRGLQWAVFERNDQPLWASIRLSVTGFMSQLHRQGGLQGASPREAFLVKCDAETTTQAYIKQGILNILVGFAPLRPAEFVMVRINLRMQRGA